MADRTEPEIQQAPNLISEFFGHLRGLFTTEFQMAKEEMAQAISRAGTGVVYLAIALLFGLVAFHALAITLVLALAALGIPMVWAALATSVLVLIVAAGFAVAGAVNLKKSTIAPKRTIAQLRQDLNLFEEATRV